MARALITGERFWEDSLKNWKSNNAVAIGSSTRGAKIVALRSRDVMVSVSTTVRLYVGRWHEATEDEIRFNSIALGSFSF